MTKFLIDIDAIVYLIAFYAVVVTYIAFALTKDPRGRK